MSTRPRVATVLTAREWEPDLVTVARATGAVRLVARMSEAEQVERLQDRVDVVVAGAETAWVTPATIKAWRRNGLAVLGVYPSGDRPAHALLARGGADEVLPDSTPSLRLLEVARLLGWSRGAREKGGHLIVVVGARGAPGRSEVALGLAWGMAERCRTLLLDLDLAAPALAVRLGLAPRPDLADAADQVRGSGELPADAVHRVGPLSLVTGVTSGTGPLGPSLLDEVVGASQSCFECVVVDPGLVPGDHPLLARADTLVLVCEASPTGIVRAARLVETWNGPAPVLVLNRAAGTDHADVVRAARRWIGLEPDVVVPESVGIWHASRRAGPPPRLLVQALASLHPTLRSTPPAAKLTPGSPTGRSPRCEPLPWWREGARRSPPGPPGRGDA